MVVGINQRSCAALDRGRGVGPSNVAERSITFYIVLIMSDACGGRGPCTHSSRALRCTGRGRDSVSSWETDASIELSVIPPQAQTETARIYISTMRQYVCWGLPGQSSPSGTKFEPSKHSTRHVLLFLPLERLMGLIHHFSHFEMQP